MALSEAISESIPQGMGFVRGYVEYASYCSDAPEVFHVGVALTILAGGLAKRLHCPWMAGRTLVPNLYTLLVGPSRSARKTGSMDIGVDVLQTVAPEQIIPIPGSYEELIAQVRDTPSGLLTYREFGHFLKTTQRGYGEQIRTVLMDLYDWPPDRTYTRNLRKGKTVIEPPICLSMLSACSTDLLFMYCVDEETEMLTATGWKHHKDVAVGEECYTLNHETGLGEWQPVKRINVFPARPQQPMILMEGRGHSSLSTPNHRWPVRHKGNSTWGRRWRTSETLNQCDYIQCAAPDAGLPTDSVWSNAFVELVAWAWTEGHWNVAGSLGIVQSCRVNAEFCERIRAALTTLFGPPHVGSMLEQNSTGDPLWVEDKPSSARMIAWRLNQQASAQFSDVMSIPEKVVSKAWLRTLTREQLELFIATSLDADGDRAKNRLAQKSQARAEAYAFACILAGKPVSYCDIDNDHNRGYEIGILSRDQVSPLASASDTFRVENTTHDGPVWCPTTPNGTWLARRKGSVYWTGNTDSSEWMGGFIGRMLVLYGERETFRMPQPWGAAREWLTGMLHRYLNAPIPQCGGFDPQAWLMFSQWSQWKDSQANQFPSRVQTFISGAATLVAKVALLYAADAGEPNAGHGWLISYESTRRAMLFVEKLYLPSVQTLGERLALSIWERDRQKVLDAIRNHPTGIDRGKLLRTVKVSSDLLETIITTLKEEDSISTANDPKLGLIFKIKVPRTHQPTPPQQPSEGQVIPFPVAAG